LNSTVQNIKNINELKPIASVSLFYNKWYITFFNNSNYQTLSKQYYIVNPQNIQRIILYGGCNVQFSTYTLTNNAIKFGPISGTKKFCAQDNDSMISNPLFSSVYAEITATTLKFYD